jgi:hypothetical protein
MQLPCQFSSFCSRYFASETHIKLEAQEEHTAESHLQDKITKFLSIPQSKSAALEHMVATNPMVSSTKMRRGLELHQQNLPPNKVLCSAR